MLTAFAVATFLGLSVITLRDALGAGPGWLLARGAVLAVLAAAATAIVVRDRWPLRQLRVVEVGVFATLAVYLAARLYMAGIADPEAAATGWTGTLIAFGLLMIAYGVFVPNALPRALAGILLIGATPIVTALAIRAADPVAFDRLAPDQLFDTVLIMLTCTGVASIAAFVGHSLFDFAYEQRKRTFYDLDRRIGSGGMGEVWAATHRTLRRPTAVKLVRQDRVQGVDRDEALRVLKRFEREAKSTAALRSPHTIDVYDFGVTEDGHFFYAMEYLEGVDLERLVEKFGPVPSERAVHLLLQACDSLADAHATGMVHRDIKPANLFLSRLGPSGDYVTLLDFGLVQDRAPGDDDETLTQEGTASGTPAYMAPETVTDPDAVDTRADIYALGCVAYWLLSGKPVFEADTGVAVIVEHVKTAPEPLSKRTELPIPAELEDIVMKCLEKNPADRFQSAAELAEALAEVPLENPWTARRAQEWWELHMAEAQAA